MSVNINPQAYTYPTVTIQQLVFTAKRWGQFPSISYTNGATAGSEVVSMDSSFNITIQIQNATSTNAQIAAALNATAGTVAGGMAAGDLCSAAPVSGHTADTPTCFGNVQMLGGVAAKAASVLIGPMLVTANATGTGGNSKTVTLLGSVNFTVTTVTDGTHLVVSSTTGLIAGSPIKQGANSTTVTTVTDGTHLVVGSTTSWTGSGAAASSVITPGSEVAIEAAGAISIQILPRQSHNATGYVYTPLGGAVNPDIPTPGAFTTWKQLLTALNGIASVDCTATFAKTGGNTSTNDLGVYSLSGGLAAAAATTGAVNGITSVANATGVTANGVFITLTPGATAGAEVVTPVTGGFQVQIQSGTSTITQVRTALNANATYSALYTATGTSATTMQAVYQNALSGAVGPDIYGWYSDNAATALTASFVYSPFGGSASTFHVENADASGSNTVIGSWDGVNNHFILVANTQRDIQTISRPGVYLKFGTAAPAYKAWTVNR